MTKTLSILTVVRIHQHVKLQTIPLMHFQITPRNPKFDIFYQAEMAPTRGKSTNHYQTLISSGSGQDTSAYVISCHSFFEISGNVHEPLQKDGRTD